MHPPHDGNTYRIATHSRCDAAYYWQGGNNGVNTMTKFLKLLPRRKTRHEAELEYLNGAVSIYDLECREREIERGRFAQF